MSATVPPPSLLASKGFLPGQYVTGLGDSISAQSTFQPYPMPAAWSVANWQTNTAYVVGNVVKNGGFYYICKTSGTSAGSGGPTGNALSGITDNTAVWGWVQAIANKILYTYLTMLEVWSQGQLTWDMNKGRSGINLGVGGVYVVNGGVNYSPSDTVTWSGGATGTLQVSDGVITGVTITSPGNMSSGYTPTITTSTGSGAVLSGYEGGTGTFGTSGCVSADCVAALNDVIASGNNIVVVLVGTNDVSQNVGYAAITANLRTIYETLSGANIRVIAVPILPRATTWTSAQNFVARRVNRWIRNYVAQQAYANPNNVSSIVLADPSQYWTDGTYTSSSAFELDVGGTTSTGAKAVTQDGLHPNNRGSTALAYCMWQAAQQWFRSAAPSPSRSYSIWDGYGQVINPGGNRLEAAQWTASTAYAFGDLCSNGGNDYYVQTAGTSASSGGPSGTGTSITDGSAKWNYTVAAGRSVLMGTGGTLNSSGSVTSSGTLPTGSRSISAPRS